MWVRARAASSKETDSSVPAWFRADSGTNLIKQGKIVTGRPCGPIALWSEYSHGLREVLGSSPGRAMCFFLPCDICIDCLFEIRKIAVCFLWLSLPGDYRVTDEALLAETT